MNNHKINNRDFYMIETLLRNKITLEKNILLRLSQIDSYERGSTIVKSNNVTERVQGTSIYKSDLDVRFELINNIRIKILDEQKRLDNINVIVDSIRNDKYFDIIDQRYFQNLSIKEICYNLNLSKDTVIRNRNRIFRLIKGNMSTFNTCPICENKTFVLPSAT